MVHPLVILMFFMSFSPAFAQINYAALELLCSSGIVNGAKNNLPGAIRQDGSVMTVAETCRQKPLANPPKTLSANESDPWLENENFPVQTTKKSIFGPMMNYALVGDIDGDLKKEVIFPGIGPNDRLHAYRHDGTPQPGQWPISTGGTVSPSCQAGIGYPSLGKFWGSYDNDGYDVVWGSQNDTFAIADGYGNSLVEKCLNDVSNPPSAMDVDGDGIDEVFMNEEDFRIHGYDSLFQPFLDVYLPQGPEPGRTTPVHADLDGDGSTEIVTVTRKDNSSHHTVWLYAMENDGTIIFELEIMNSNVFTFPVVGDVDGDGDLEIVLNVRGFGELSPVINTNLMIISKEGQVEAQLEFEGWDLSDYYSSIALADVDDNSVPEIVFQNTYGVYILKHSQGIYENYSENWPVVWEWDGEPNLCYPFTDGYSSAKSGPVVGDIDGDQEVEIVLTTVCGGGNGPGRIHALNLDGSQLSEYGFPKLIQTLGLGGVPAIADLDLDGRNEIVVVGLYYTNPFCPPGCEDSDHLFVYDLGGNNHGRIEWGQFQGGPSHTGLYEKPPANRSIEIMLKYDSDAKKLKVRIYDPDGLSDVVRSTLNLQIDGNPVNYFGALVQSAQLTELSAAMVTLELPIDLTGLSGTSMYLSGSDSVGNSAEKTIVIQ